MEHFHYRHFEWENEPVKVRGRLLAHWRERQVRKRMAEWIDKKVEPLRKKKENQKEPPKKPKPTGNPVLDRAATARQNFLGH